MAGPARAYLGLGSNLTDRKEHLAHALRSLRELGEIDGTSGVYETPPEGHEDQPPFLNLVVSLLTLLEPQELLECAQGIERDRGRVRTYRNAPRTLDIDILLYEDRLLELEGLIVPHPRMHRRTFVLVPLLELAPALADPRSGRPYAELLAELPAADEPGGSEAGGAGAGLRRVMDGEELLNA